MSNAVFYILCEKDGAYKELSVQVPKKYHYETTYFNYTDFPSQKVTEYNILADFIKNNRGLIQEKWNFNDDEYNQLNNELKITLIRAHSTCSFPRKVILEAIVLFKLFIKNLVRRIKI